MKKEIINPREKIKNIQLYDENNKLVLIVHENGITKVDENYTFQLISNKKDHVFDEEKYFYVKHSLSERIGDWFFKDLNSTVSIVSILVSIVTTVALLLLLGWLQLIPL